MVHNLLSSHLHVDQGIVGDRKPLGQIEAEGLFSVRKNVPRHL